jgi:uroporphyrinogen decarboxylase
MPEPLLLQAFKGQNKRIPVWLMRQAGRYLPEYQRIKEKYPLEEMFRKPEIASEITCQPIDKIGVDAAILFADILTLPSQMGFDIQFINGQGPSIRNPIKKITDVSAIHHFDDLEYVAETVKMVKQRLRPEIALIGFAGSPFTVLCYLLSGTGNVNLNTVNQFMEEYPEYYYKLMQILTQNTIAYLKLQKSSGIDAYQIFDTWAGSLRPADYALWVLPFVKKIFSSVDLPSIYYVKNCKHLLALMEQSEADFLSVCHTVVLGHEPILSRKGKGIQGNLFNGLLFAPQSRLAQEVNDVLLGARHYKKYIFNLSHGVLPNVEVDKVKFVVDQVHEFHWEPIEPCPSAS